MQDTQLLIKKIAGFAGSSVIRLHKHPTVFGIDRVRFIPIVESLIVAHVTKKERAAKIEILEYIDRLCDTWRFTGNIQARVLCILAELRETT